MQAGTPNAILPGRTRNLMLAGALACGVALTGCTPTEEAKPETPAPETRIEGTTDPARPGVVIYDGYEAAIVQEGDTVSSVAERVGVSATALANYNGLRETSALRPGDELVLPPAGG